MSDVPPEQVQAPASHEPVERREPEPEPRREYRGTGVYVPAILAFLLAAVLVVFIVQNTEGVELEWAVWEANVSLAAIVLGAIAAGALLAAIVGWLWRRGRRRSLQEREELRRLRSERG